MAKINWDKLSLDELKDIQKQAGKAISTFEARKKQEALAAVEAKAVELGFTLKSLVGSGSAKASKAPPKYAHPENPTLTWSGRGRQPGWIKEGLSSGKSLEDFAI